MQHNCRVRNSAGNGVNISSNSDGACVTDTHVFCDDDQTKEQNATDYYFHIGDTDECEIWDCEIYRIPLDSDAANPTQPLPSHKGHGFVLAGWQQNSFTCSGNTLNNCYAHDVTTILVSRSEGNFE